MRARAASAWTDLASCCSAQASSASSGEPSAPGAAGRPRPGSGRRCRYVGGALIRGVPVGVGEFVRGQAERSADVLGVVAVLEHRGGDGRVGGGFGEHRVSGRGGVGAGEVREQPHQVVFGAGQSERAQQAGEVVLVTGVPGDQHRGGAVLAGAERGQDRASASRASHMSVNIAGLLRSRRTERAPGTVQQQLGVALALGGGERRCPRGRCHSREAGGSG
ncbi:hypothetical protein ADK86_07335 [Streptomyces sp. NRRL F-5755]|nr:hypothetical protein ADK86_07335 [Streptomyces sp. NRRL F-5755]